eukprot:CAMPEP_0115285580 /NCGR_PEP_ID=MMETSP0270-20121206/61504_1 /TAXON_ID=71861 /ORGANISM="Scrippsiella trochoidea, Strain CCMP3099" /LENGTH=38 /DNA_ID= /DNA_START= /DNA_END= /DNA_ORIENTATION=
MSDSARGPLSAFSASTGKSSRETRLMGRGEGLLQPSRP